MSNEFELSPTNQELERALGSLKPASLNLDRDRLMFQAGQASVARRRVGWPLLSGVLALLLFVSWNDRTESGLLPKAVTVVADHIQTGAPAKFNRWISMSASLSDEEETGGIFENSYWQLRNQVALYGVDKLRQETSGLQSDSPQTWKSFHRMKSLPVDQNM